MARRFVESASVVEASSAVLYSRRCLSQHLPENIHQAAATLTAALQSGHVSAAALDVFNPEPIPANHPIRTMPNVILAAHISSVSIPAVTNLRETTAKIALMALRGEALINVVNGVKA